jgi:predicted AlkP superfamily pyrophosphatase or phosphodiesterase
MSVPPSRDEVTMRGRRLPVFVAWLLVVGVAFAAPGAGAAPSPSSPSPRLAVIVVLDGLSWDALAGAKPAFTAGLKRLLDEGLVESACRYRHLNTETGPGHASLSTGAPPSVNGIVGNDWHEMGPGGKMRRVYCAEEAGATGATARKGPFHLAAPTFGDRLVEQRPGARVVSIAGKDRAAIFLAGKNPKHVVYWLDSRSGQFVTTPAYDPSAPGAERAAAIVAAFNASRGGAKLGERYGTVWKKLDGAPLPAGVKAPAAEADIAPYQVPAVGIGFDHDLAKAPSGFIRGFFYSPFQDEAMTDLALDLLGDDELGLGRGSVPDLLCVSFSANDYVAHAYGPESAESLDLLRRFDRSIGRLLDALDRRFGKGGVTIALSADHGMSPIPEVERKRDPSFKGKRLYDRETASTLTTFQDWLTRLIDRDLCLDPAARPIRALGSWSAYYDRDILPLRTVAGPCGPAGREVTSADLDGALERVVARFFADEIEEVLPISRQSQWPSADPAVPFARNDLYPGRSGEVFLVPRYGMMLSGDPGRGTTHGSQFEPDTHVPLLFWGAGIAPGVSGADTAPYDLAPTLAKILGVRLPDATGRSLVP